MRLSPSQCFGLLSAALLLAAGSAAQAAPPAEQLLPERTLAFFWTGDYEEASDKFNQTQFGRLLDDPAMEAFSESLRKQFRDNIGIDQTLGLSAEDVEGLAKGEAFLAYMHLEEELPGWALVVDVTDNLDKANEVIDKAVASLKEQGATSKTHTIGGEEVTEYTLPEDEDRLEVDRYRVYFIKDNWLVAAQGLHVARDIHGRFAEPGEDTLASFAPFEAVMSRAEKDSAGMEPHVRWYVDPFGLMKAARVADPSLAPEDRTDLYQALLKSGFGAVQAAGGYVNFAVDRRDILHRTKIYAPRPWDKSMQVLETPNDGQQKPPAWALADVASYWSANLKMINAFDHFGPIFDETYGDGQPDVWRDVVDSLAHDPNGPQVHLRDDLIVHLENRATVVTDYKLPIQTDSERRILGIPTTNSELVSKAVDRLMKDDPAVVQRKVPGLEGIVIYEMGHDDEPTLPELRIEGGGRRPPPRRRPVRRDDEPTRHRAICVAHGHLFVASHVDFLVKVLEQAGNQESLAGAADYRLVDRQLEQHLERIGAQNTAARAFAYTSETFRPTFELLRQGKMAEADTMLGRMLNRVLGDPDSDEPRKQQIDGTKLPDFDRIRRYFGPAGLFVISEDDGWFVSGIMYSKD